MTEKRQPSPAPATIVLVPGFWLGEWAWDAVATRLDAAGVAVEALTLPGLEPGTTDADATLDDQIDAVVAAISRASGPVVLVGHSGAGTVITGAADRAPASLAGLVFVDSGPVADGAVADGAVASPEGSPCGARRRADQSASPRRSRSGWMTASRPRKSR